MQLADFFDRVEKHPELEGVGLDACQDNRPGVLVRHRPSQLTTRLPVDAVEAADWGPLEDVLVGKREPVALQHMTRVVGYFSRVENWNKSKIGELTDRQTGCYALREPGESKK